MGYYNSTHQYKPETLKNKQGSYFRVIPILGFCMLMFLYILLLLYVCDADHKDETKFYYRITYTIGLHEIDDVSINEIEYLEGGRIKFCSFNNGHPDTVIIGGTYIIEKY